MHPLTKSYVEAICEFDELLDMAKKVACALNGVEVEARHRRYTDPIYGKLVAHAVSLRKLCPDPRLPVEGEFWDLSSCCAVSRCIVETHSALAYVSFGDIPPKVRELRIAVWELHDSCKRLQVLESLGSKNPKVEEVRQQAESARKAVTINPLFGDLPRETQRQILTRNHPPEYLMTLKERCTANSINYDYYHTVTMFLSQYVHTLPMAVHQLSSFHCQDPRAQMQMAMPLEFAMGFMAKAAGGMIETFQIEEIATTKQSIQHFEKWFKTATTGVKQEQASG